MLSHLKKTPLNREGAYCIEFDLAKFHPDDKKCGIAKDLSQRISSYSYPYGTNVHGVLFCDDHTLLRNIEEDLCHLLQQKSGHYNFKSDTNEWFNLSNSSTHSICQAIADKYQVKYKTSFHRDELKNSVGLYIISPALRRLGRYRKIGCSKRIFRRLHQGYTTAYPYGFTIKCVAILNTSNFHYMFEKLLKNDIKCFGNSEYTTVSYDYIFKIFLKATKMFEHNYPAIYKNGKHIEIMDKF